jgi:chromate transporter
LTDQGDWREVSLVFLRLGLTSFGGPVAHIAYFRAECVERRRWLDDRAYADIVALCQFLPGPASSQVGLSLGLRRAGYAGALAAWLGFTAPSAAIMIVFALGLNFSSAGALPLLHGLKIVAVAVVAQAVWTMGLKFCGDALRATVALGAAALALAAPSAFVQIAAIVLGGLVGWAFLPPQETPGALDLPVSRRFGLIAGALYLALLAGLPLLAHALGDSSTLGLAAEKFAAIYRAGALVFGGGHVVLPLLRDALVTPGWIGDGAFIDGYGAAQALPGPLFTFAACLGAAMPGAPTGVAGGLLALAAIFLPGALLLFAVLPFWEVLRARRGAAAALAGVNAAVVGLLFAALCTPIWTSAIFSGPDFLMALAAFGLLVSGKAPPWLVVVMGAAAMQSFG